MFKDVQPLNETEFIGLLQKGPNIEIYKAMDNRYHLSGIEKSEKFFVVHENIIAYSKIKRWIKPKWDDYHEWFVVDYSNLPPLEE